MIIRKSAREIERMAAAGAVVAGTLALLEEQLSPRRSRWPSSTRSPTTTSTLMRRRPHLEGLQGLPGRDLHLAQRHDRARHPRLLSRPRGRHHLVRRRCDEGRDDRRLGRDLRRRQDLDRGAAATRCLPAAPLDAGIEAAQLRAAVGRHSRRPFRPSSRRRAIRWCAAWSATVSGKAYHEDPPGPELRHSLPRPAAPGGDDARNRADDHGRWPRRLHPRRRVVDFDGRRLPRGAFRAYGRDHARSGPRVLTSNT